MKRRLELGQHHIIHIDRDSKLVRTRAHCKNQELCDMLLLRAAIGTCRLWAKSGQWTWADKGYWLVQLYFWSRQVLRV